MTRDELVARVRAVLTPDLLHPDYRHNPKAHCYAASEAAFYLLGGKVAGYTPHTLHHEGSTHWFLRHADGSIIDPTADQFRTPPPYHAARGRGFLTREPSTRARTIMQRITMNQPDIAEQLIEAALNGTFDETLADVCEAGRWIAKMHMKKGAFTRKASAHGESPAEFQQDVLSHPGGYSAKTKHEANLRKTLVGLHH